MTLFPRITISGARGIIGNDLTVENAQRMAWAYARFIEGGAIVLGQDARQSGRLFHHAVISGLMAGGADVIDVGPAPTPTVGIMIRELQAKGGVAITASHNPSQWNALKFFAADGTFPESDFVDNYITFLHRGDYNHVAWDEIPTYETNSSALQTHCRSVLSAIDCRKIHERKFHVVVDGCRSVGGIFLPHLLARLNCTVITLDCVPDGNFTRGMEPTPNHLTALMQLVSAEQADLGFAVDPDADRLAVVSNEGKAIGEEFTLALSTYAALKRVPGGAVVTNLSSSLLNDHAAKQFGGRVIRTPIGEANVVRGIRDHNAVIGGEGNGGVMYPAVHIGRDALTGAALILQLLAESGKSVSEIVSEFPHYVILKDKVEMDLRQAHKKLETIAAMPHEEELDIRDGVKIIYDNAWLHIRCSNTEPIVRIIAEAEGEEKTRKFIEQGKTWLS